MNQTILNLLLIILIAYVVINVVLFFTQSKLIYFPTKEIQATPASIGLEYEQVYFQTKDGVKISAWHVPSNPSKGILLFFHGNAGNISHRLDSLKIFNQLGLDVLIIDYRGYGESMGNPTEQGTYLDAEGAWDYIKKHYPGKDVYIFGRSIGGAVASWLATKVSPKGLIVESAFTSVPDLASQFYPFFPVRLLSRYNYNTLEYIKKVHVPVLVVHSPMDDIIPFSHGEKIFEAANEPKSFLRITGGHNDGFLMSGKDYVQGLKKFIDFVTSAK
jgi:fermentation-respiration switch protein FrsA (DUF1100 family)